MKTNKQYKKLILINDFVGNSYNADVQCDNCGFKGDISIPMGNTIQSVPCSMCGCKELMRTHKIML